VVHGSLSRIKAACVDDEKGQIEMGSLYHRPHAGTSQKRGRFIAGSIWDDMDEPESDGKDNRMSKKVHSCTILVLICAQSLAGKAG
jgi:hypothetical protein